MRISDWSSDVCSSDLCADVGDQDARRGAPRARRDRRPCAGQLSRADGPQPRRLVQDRKSVVEGKSVSVRVDLGGRRIIKKKTKTNTQADSTTRSIKRTTRREGKHTVKNKETE